MHSRKSSISAYMSPMPGIKSLKIPVYYSQVKEDNMTIPKDLEEIYEATPVEEKTLHWIEWEGHTDRFHGYQYWYNFPEKMIKFLNKHTGGMVSPMRSRTI